MKLAENIRTTIQTIIKNINDRYLELAELLYKVQNENLYKGWGYNTFLEYIQTELNIRKTKAHYLIDVFEKIILQAEVPKDQLDEIGWSKLKELAPIITKENAPKLLKSAKEDTVEEIQKEVREAKNTIVTPTKEILHLVKFGLYDSQYNLWKTAEESATKLLKAEGREETMNNVVDIMCSQFLALPGCKIEKGLDFLLNSLERTYNIKVIAIKGNDSILFGKKAFDRYIK